MKLLFFPMAASPGCPIVTSRSGGIGRRAWFRSMYPQGCGGSSPFFGTSKFDLFLQLGGPVHYQRQILRILHRRLHHEEAFSVRTDFEKSGADWLRGK